MDLTPGPPADILGVIPIQRKPWFYSVSGAVANCVPEDPPSSANNRSQIVDKKRVCVRSHHRILARPDLDDALTNVYRALRSCGHVD